MSATRWSGGDVVLQLDRGPFETNLKRARAGLALAQAEAAQARQELERVQRLAEQEVAPAPATRPATDSPGGGTGFASSRNSPRSRAPEQDLVRTAVVSPYHAPRVVERELHEGAIVGPGSVVVTIQEQTGFAAELDVPRRGGGAGPGRRPGPVDRRRARPRLSSRESPR